jgi:hypothetical protein
MFIYIRNAIHAIDIRTHKSFPNVDKKYFKLIIPQYLVRKHLQLHKIALI